MKNKQHQLSKRKHELYNKKRQLAGKKTHIIEAMTPDEAEYVSGMCEIEPYMYKVWKAFRPGFSPKNAPKVLRKIYYKKENPAYLVMSKSEVETCRAAGLKPHPVRYKIDLRTLK